MDFVEICNVCARKAIIEAAKRIINSDKVRHSYSDLDFGVTFFGTQCTGLRFFEVFRLDRAIGKGGSVCPSVHHTSDPYINGSRYRNKFFLHVTRERCF